MDEPTQRTFRRNLIAWFGLNARVLPWRTTPRDPYAVWVSEVMLQQTRVATVIPFFDRFIQRFPTLGSLGAASLDDVLSAWSGLGYYRRARALHTAARQMVERGESSLPSSREGLLELSGIGQYTAAAIASIAYDEPVAVVDGNVLRVLARVTADKGAVDLAPTQRRIRTLADCLVDPKQPGRFNEAMMELGATVCTPWAPSCPACPVRRQCQGRRLGLAQELPLTRARKASPVVRLMAFVVLRGDAVLMARRCEEGLFGGLWEPPMIEADTGALRTWLKERVEEDRTIPRGKVTHVLTHRVLEVRVTRWKLSRPLQDECPMPQGYDRLRWVRQDGRQALGMSALAGKVLAHARVDGLEGEAMNGKKRKPAT
jgi:A/G-specific adenine glycosylase